MYKTYRKWLKSKLDQFRKNPDQDKKDYRNKSYPANPAALREFDFLDFITPFIGGKLNKIGSEYYNFSEAHRWRLFHTWDLLHTGEPQLVPCEMLDNVPQIVHVVPSQDTGGLILGTLGFRRRKARKLINLGYVDMLRVVESLLVSVLKETKH